MIFLIIIFHNSIKIKKIEENWSWNQEYTLVSLLTIYKLIVELLRIVFCINMWAKLLIFKLVMKKLHSSQYFEALNKHTMLLQSIQVSVVLTIVVFRLRSYLITIFMFWDQYHN